MSKIFAWIEEQLGRLANFCSDAIEDLKAADEKLSEKLDELDDKARAEIKNIITGNVAKLLLLVLLSVWL